ncbi:MAG TPA: hypothetical protein VFD72_07595 [Sphingobacteriaceae bacterium]|nr:hypothetical protein [Sphingobacteriaceae bacterium]
MKRLTRNLSVFALVLMGHFAWASTSLQSGLDGAWRYQEGQITHIAVFVDGYVSHSWYDQPNQNFIATRGGTYSFQNGQLSIDWQWDTEKAAAEVDPGTWIGQRSGFTAELSGDALQSNLAGSQAAWSRIDQNGAPLTGVWRMSGRKQGDEISNSPLRARRTLKILSGERFQWIAINIETGAFSGTGGGTYTFENGKYTENIEFFSRDGSRVGASLTFDGDIQNGKWHHSGLSSVGNPIYEIWEKLEE